MNWRLRLWLWAPPFLTAIAAVIVCAAGIHWGTFAAADSDPYGYVSEADLIAHGSLRVDQRFARDMPWPNPEMTLCPPAYRPTADGFIVPMFPPGLPLLMALFQHLKGRAAVFYVIPLLGAVAVWMTGRLGARLHSPLVGLLAAMLLSTSVIFLYQLMQPVSDVAATAWWTVGLVLILGDGWFVACGAGLAASMAILTRPNLVPLAVVIALFVVWQAARADRGDRRRHLHRLSAFLIGMAPGCLGVAAFNQYLYGSPFQSGYYDSNLLYAWSHVLPNLRLYPHWLVETSAAFIFVALAAPWFVRKRDVTALLLAFSAVVFASYIFYVPWGRDEWGYLRFVLPAFPPLLALGAAVLVDAAKRISNRTEIAAAVALAFLGTLATWQAHEAVRHGALATSLGEQRYVDVGRYVNAVLPRNAIFITRAEAGSLRYYSARTTIRTDQLDPAWLDRAVDALRAEGYHPYMVLEESEEAPFREQFGSVSMLGRLDWPPLVERSRPIRVRVYDPLDRERYLAGDGVLTGDMDVVRKPRLRVIGDGDR